MRVLETRCLTAHHDGSPLYVPDPKVELGGTCSVYVVTGPELPTRAIWARTTPDGDTHFTEGVVDRVEGEQTWWRVELSIVNPDTNYRFVLDTERGQKWLTANGVSDTYVSDAADFAVNAFPPPPTWARDAVVYEIFPDRFRKSGRVTDPFPEWAVPAQWNDEIPFGTSSGVRQIFGGDLWGVAEKLDYIASLGANVIYLTPFFPARSNHRYDASTFEHVDPMLGGDEALIHLVEQAHSRGIRIVGDITLNHTGDAHEWFKTAQSDPTSVEAGFYYFDDDGGYASFCGEPSLPKLDHRSEELRRRLYEGPTSIVARYLGAPFNLDGWRVDVAQSTGRFGSVELNDEVARVTRRTVADVASEAILWAENGFDATRALRGDGWAGVMAYSGFARPVWQWLAQPRDLGDFWGVPGGIPPYDGEQMVAAMSVFSAATPWSGVQSSLNLLDSHDTQRFRWAAGETRLMLGAALMMTLPGIPMIFAGDEVGVTGGHMEDARRPFPWDGTSWDGAASSAEVESFYRELLAVRRAHPALAYGSMRWLHASDDSVVYLRELPGERMVVQVCREDGVLSAISVPETAEAVFGAEDLVAGDALPVAGPAVRIWRLADSR